MLLLCGLTEHIDGEGDHKRQPDYWVGDHVNQLVLNRDANRLHLFCSRALLGHIPNQFPSLYQRLIHFIAYTFDDETTMTVQDPMLSRCFGVNQCFRLYRGLQSYAQKLPLHHDQ